MTIETLLNSLTLADATTYNALTDKIVWIETTLLDPHDINRGYWPAVEDALIDILKVAKC
jgi:hypothetical protein